MPKFTVEQQKAIDDRNVNILVAAAAGSGKTTVLVERIKKLIIEEGCSLENMLIVTFTELAAKEMKEKIVKAIDAAICDADDSLRQRLKKELSILPNANISTFHSFALDVIRKFYYLIGIEPNLKIIDETQKEMLLSESLEELIDFYFKKGDKRFIDFLNRYTGERSNRNFGEMISFTYEKIMAMAEPFEWLKGSVALSAMKKDDFLNSNQFRKFVEEIESRLNSYIERFDRSISWANTEGLPALSDFLSLDRVPFIEIRNMLRDGRYDEIYKYDLPQKTRLNKSVKGEHGGVMLEDVIASTRDEARDFLKEKVKGEFFFDTMDNLVADINATAPLIQFLSEAVIKYDEIFTKKKAKKAYMTFNDIEHYAFEILKCDEASSYYRNRFKHIFIDEFQDTNGVQFAITEKIAGGRNLFMVGDVKQSIYRFRQADPSLFEERYRTFRNAEKICGAMTDSEAIDLNANFRSRKSVIDYVNTVFADIMDNYDDNAKLNGKCPTLTDSKQDARLFLLEVEGTESEDTVLDEIEELGKTQKEALATVKLINDCKKKYGYRNRDIAVLLRGIKNSADIYYGIFSENGISSFIDDNSGYFDTIEINTVCSLLNVIDNEMQDVDLLTVMRSEIFGFTVKEMADIRIAYTSGSYYSSVKSYSEEGSDSGLREKCSNILSVLARYRELSFILPLEELIWDILLETGFYVSMGALPNGARRQANLRALIDKAQNYRENYSGLLYGFTGYIASIKDKKIEMGQVRLISEEDDVVKIMTIHKSKGLEFPVVILPGYASRLNYKEGAPNLVMDNETGLALNYVDYEKSYKRSTLLKNIISYYNRKAASDEEKRILYVAMTRAEHILYLLGSTDNVDKKLDEFRKGKRSDTSYLSMTGKVMIEKALPIGKLGINDLAGISEERQNDMKAVSALFEKTPDDIDSETDSLMNFRYEFSKELEVKSKYSVSELNAEGRSTYRRLSIPRSISGRKNFTRAEIGTITHKVLFMLDLKRAESEKDSYIEELLSSMVKEEILTTEETDAVDRRALIVFAESELGKRMAASSTVYREQAFNLQIPVNGVYTLVQGIIDCFFFEDDGIVLIDYKTTEKSDEEYVRNEYRKQIALYREAIEKAGKGRVKEAYLYLTNFGKVIKMDDC